MNPWQEAALSLLISCPQVGYTVVGGRKFPDSGEVQAEVRVCGGHSDIRKMFVPGYLP